MLLLSQLAFNPRHASRTLLTFVLFTVMRALPLHEGCDPRSLVFSLLQPWWDSLLCLGFADSMYAVNWNDHSCQSLCSPANVGALPTERVSTSGATFGATEIRSLVLSKACSLCIRLAISASISARTRASDMAECLKDTTSFSAVSFFVGSSPAARIPRLRIYTLFHFSQLWQTTRPASVHVCHHQKPSHTGEVSNVLQACARQCVSTQHVTHRETKRSLALQRGTATCPSLARNSLNISHGGH